ncbi:glycosyltransferase family 2 protein [Tersicoccus phoenicis]|uniref:glycosyltransferase family 2 protein n=1 Tax=Tersicoccus phoenicis TaxID=554083 RepID=UPI001F490C2D|nr:glycosyltransferase family 2 protein [Tersicoccus phoenicis]
MGLIILGAVGFAAALLWWGVAANVPARLWEPVQLSIAGVWSVFYDANLPDLRVLAIAGALALFLGAGIALVERRVATLYRRSPPHLVSRPLAPRVIMNATRGVFAGPVTITVLIPAHNEQVTLPGTLASLREQDRRPDRIVVVADNCTDRTAELARAGGAEVYETVGNTEKKGGALNQVLRTLLPDHRDNDVVMVMDADTTLDDGFLAAAEKAFEGDRALMAVGGLFYGEEGHGLIGQFQRNEYVRYSREIARRRGRVFVLTGTASIFRPVALRTIAALRGTQIPGRPGDVYDTAALTEDNELTLALKSLGGLMISPPGCTVVTELMPTWHTLWAQRLRWERGALENLGAYGVTPQTFRYWAQQLGIGYSVIGLSTYLLLIAVMLASMDTWIWFPFWLGVGVLFAIERVVTAWKGGWRARLLALTIFPELFFDLFLDVVFVKGILDITRGRRATWSHLTRTETPAPAARP